MREKIEFRAQVDRIEAPRPKIRYDWAIDAPRFMGKQPAVIQLLAPDIDGETLDALATDENGDFIVTFEPIPCGEEVEPALKPCAHCGSHKIDLVPVKRDHGVSMFRVQCDACGVNVEAYWDAKTAIAAWNRRA
jgi:Lar family restriction alleviation protein